MTERMQKNPETCQSHRDFRRFAHVIEAKYTFCAASRHAYAHHDPILAMTAAKRPESRNVAAARRIDETHYFQYHPFSAT
ncbi:hypothetical protein [Salipiger pallidus]|uniref:hypothetical protein n=1 Tax=Salipiger pallidus TaxID=1775170 RepID=UPI001663C9E2|nr:hypothetical protein [Salipiger pallidus]